MDGEVTIYNFIRMKKEEFLSDLEKEQRDQ